MLRRFHHAYLVVVGRLPLSFSTEQMEFIMALENFNAKAAELADAADRLIAHCQGHEAALAQAQSDLVAADANATAAIQPTLDKISAAAPSAA